LPACLRSLRPDLDAGNIELLAVDNASPDGSAAIVTSVAPEAHVIRSSLNRGFAGGCKLPWEAVRGRYWMLLNPDVVVPEGGIETLVRWMDDHPEHGMASPELVDRAGNTQCAARRFPTTWRSLIEMSRLHLLLPPACRARLLLGSYRLSFGDCVSADWVPATAVMVRPRAVREVGLPDATLPLYAEDSEWCWRFRQAGWRIGVCGATRFRHDEGVSAIASLGRDARDATMWRGIYTSCARRLGASRARHLACVNLCAFTIEASLPWRSPPHREHSRYLARLHRALLAAPAKAAGWP